MHKTENTPLHLFDIHFNFIWLTPLSVKVYLNSQSEESSENDAECYGV